MLHALLNQYDVVTEVLLLLKVLHVDERILILKVQCTLVDHFTVVCSVTWPLNDSEVGGDLVLIQTSLVLLCKSSCS